MCDKTPRITSQFLQQRCTYNSESPNKFVNYRILCGVFTYKSSIILLWTQRRDLSVWAGSFTLCYNDNYSSTAACAAAKSAMARGIENTKHSSTRLCRRTSQTRPHNRYSTSVQPFLRLHTGQISLSYIFLFLF